MSLQGQRTTTGAIPWEDFKSLIGKLERDGNYKYCLSDFNWCISRGYE